MSAHSQQGVFTDEETRGVFSVAGLQFHGTRLYDPSTGRFLSRDPLGYAGGANLYQYCDGDPGEYDGPVGAARHAE